MLGFRPRKSDPVAAEESISLEALFESLEEPLLAYALKITECFESAQDVVQEAFLSFQQAVGIRSPRAWLYRTVHNSAINLSKKAARNTPLPDEGAADLSGEDPLGVLPSEALERLEIVGLTQLFLKGLDERSRLVVSLKFDEGLSYREIGERTGLTASNVGYILHHAIAELAAEFEKIGVGK